MNFYKLYKTILEDNAAGDGGVFGGGDSFGHGGAFGNDDFYGRGYAGIPYVLGTFTRNGSKRKKKKSKRKKKK